MVRRGIANGAPRRHGHAQAAGAEARAGEVCAGRIVLRSTGKRRRGHAADAGRFVFFRIAARKAKALRVPLPSVTKKQLVKRRKAIVRATVTLSTGFRRTTELTVLR